MSDDPHTRLVTLLSLLPSLPDAEYHERLLLARDRPLDVSLLGAFALYVHIYGTLPGTDPSGSEQHEGPRDQSYAVNLILQRSQFLAYLFPCQIGFVSREGRRDEAKTEHYENGLIVEITPVSQAVPSTQLDFTVPGAQRWLSYNVAKGPYLALDLIHTHLSPTSYRGHHPEERRACLALLLHALVLSAPSRPSLRLPVHVDQQGRTVLERLSPARVAEVKAHPDFGGRWKGTLTEFVTPAYRDNLVSAASNRFDYSYWNNSRSQVGSIQNFNAWVQTSLEQVSDLLAPLLESSSSHLVHSNHHHSSALSSSRQGMPFPHGLPPLPGVHAATQNPFLAAARPPATRSSPPVIDSARFPPPSLNLLTAAVDPAQFPREARATSRQRSASPSRRNDLRSSRPHRDRTPVAGSVSPTDKIFNFRRN